MLRFALVTLVHNKDKFLTDCFRSTFRQTFKDFLHIVVNDGSTDNSEEVINHFVKKKGNIVYYPFKDKAGQMPRYNYVLRKLNKNYPHIKYMGHLDGDDMLLPDAIHDTFKYFETTRRKNVGHLSTKFYIMDAKNTVVDKKPRDFPRLDNINQWRKAQIINNLFGHFRVMRMDCLNKVGGFDEQFEFATDYNMACRMLDKFNVDVLPRPLYLWRRHGKQVEGINGKKQTECWRLMQQYYKKRWKL